MEFEDLQGAPSHWKRRLHFSFNECNDIHYNDIDEAKLALAALKNDEQRILR